jgi:IS5 family transposase
MRQSGFWVYEEQLARLTKGGDPLVKQAEVVDFEPFRSRLEKALRRSDRAKGGRPPYNPVLMFKVLVLQALYNLSGDQAEFQSRDRLSFMRFLGLNLGVQSPDAKTIWLFREQLAPAKAAQKDVSARWTIKRGSIKRSNAGAPPPAQIMVPMFGYKNHAGIDRTFGFVRKWTVTHAARHDSGAFEDVLDQNNIARSVWADTAYRSAKNERAVRQAKLKAMIHFRKPKGKAMPAPHRRANAARSKVRSGGRACFCRAEAPHGPVHPHDRHRACKDENRHGQPRL